MRSRPMPCGAGLGDQRQFGGDLEVGLQLHLLAVRGDGGQAAQLGRALRVPGRRRPTRRAALRPGPRARGGARWCRRRRRAPPGRRGRRVSVRPGTPSTAGMPSARSMMAVWPSAPPSSVATPAMRDGSSSAASAGVSSSATRMAPSGRPLKAAEGGAVRLRIRRRPISRTSSARRCSPALSSSRGWRGSARRSPRPRRPRPSRRPGARSRCACGRRGPGGSCRASCR